MSSQQHQTDPRILDRRTLKSDHRCLAELLSPGMSVLDVGCGTGAITRGIAEAVGPSGVVIGVDRNRGLLERARVHCPSLPNLRFEEGDATRLEYEARFDVVTAARTLQWIDDPKAALERMTRAAKPGGLVVVLDYNHSLNVWHPAPPAEFAAFYSAFLAWREANGWDNELANHCPALFEEVGLQEIRSYVQDDSTVKADNDFDEKSALWVQVIDNIGPTLQSARVCDAPLLQAARRSYDAWRKADLARHTLSMRTTVARVPDRSSEERASSGAATSRERDEIRRLLRAGSHRNPSSVGTGDRTS
jgi:SAM-dependent methyltransferase